VKATGVISNNRLEKMPYPIIKPENIKPKRIQVNTFGTNSCSVQNHYQPWHCRSNQNNFKLFLLKTFVFSVGGIEQEESRKDGKIQIQKLQPIEKSAIKCQNGKITKRLKVYVAVIKSMHRSSPMHYHGNQRITKKNGMYLFFNHPTFAEL
jgi:hypothetical protein